MTQREPASARISAVISDVDGTLVTNDKILTDPSRLAVERLRASGIRFGLISARPPRGLLALIKALAIDTPVAGFNGGVIANPDLTVISQHLLAPETAREAIDLLTERGLAVWVFSGQDWLLRDPGQSYVALEQRTVGFAPTIVDDFGSRLESVAKIVGVSADFAHLARCEHDVAAALAGRASVARSQAYYLDITHSLANKGAALGQLARILAVPLADIAVIGDGANDVAMFERSGLSIAMGNAKPPVQQAADFVTDSNGDDGFAKAMDRYILDRQGLKQT